MRRDTDFSDPFGLASTPSAYVARASSERAMQALDSALIENEIPGLIGSPGLGKTLLLQRVAARLDDYTAPVYVPYSTLTLPELCKLVLGLVEEPVTDDPEDALRHIIEELHRNRASLLLLIDDAAMMPCDTALQLAEWIATSKGALKVALAAVESPEARKVFASFGERLTLIRLDEEMTLDETREYVRRRLAIVAAPQSLRDAFDDDTVELLYLEGHGNPRAINIAAQSLVRDIMPDDAPLLEEIYDPTIYDIRVEEPAAFETETPAVEPETEACETYESILVDAPSPDMVEPLCESPNLDVTPDADDHGSYRVVGGRRVKNAEGDLGSYEGRATVERIPPGAQHIAAQIDDDEGVDEPESSALEELREELLVEDDVAIADPGAMAPPAPSSPTLLARILALGDAISRRPLPTGISIAGAIALGLACGSLLGPDSVGISWPEPVPSAAPAAQPSVEISAPTHAIGINATPWAFIEVDGAQIGETPIAGLELSEGSHSIRAYFPDGTVEKKNVEIDATTRAVFFD